jgi:hypothetical protein
MPDKPNPGTQPTNLDFEKSLMFFHAYMFGPLRGKIRIYGARNVRGGAAVLSSDWEVFASMLVNDLGSKLGAGIDLANNEVKSLKRPKPGSSRGGYEYQYHKIRGRGDLAKHVTVGHLFFEYSSDLSEVELRYLHGSQLAEFFCEWLAEFPDPYQQRYRKSIPFGHVREHGKLLMVLKDGEVTFPELKQELAASANKDAEEDSSQED